MTSVLWGAFPPRDGAAPSILGEKVGSFFGGGSGCSDFDGWPSDDEDWCTPMAYLPGMSPPLFDQADGRGPRPRCCVSCCFFLVV
jgi:hypothetical protein